MNIILVAATLGIVVGILAYARYRVAAWRKRIRQETYEAQGTLHTMFDVLRGDIAEQFDNLKSIRSKGRMAEEEEKAQQHIEEGLDVAERFAQKEIEDIEKEVD